MHRSRFLHAAIAAALVVVALAAGGAHASEAIEFNPGGTVELTSPAITFKTLEIAIICPVTLNATLASSIPQVEGEAMGSVTSATILAEACTPGRLTRQIRRASFLRLPWPVTLSAVAGTLPNVTRVDVAIAGIGVLFRYEAEIAGPLQCLYGGSLNAGFATPEGVASALAFASNTYIQLVIDLTHTSLCGQEVQVLGSFALSPAQTVSAI